MLLEAKANPSLKNKYGNTALHEAAYAGGLNVVKSLIKAGASVFEKNASALTPREFALKNNQLEVAAYLQKVEKSLSRPRSPKPQAKP